MRSGGIVGLLLDHSPRRPAGGLIALLGVTARKSNAATARIREPPERCRLSVILLFLVGEFDIRSFWGLASGRLDFEAMDGLPQILSRGEPWRGRMEDQPTPLRDLRRANQSFPFGVPIER